MTHSEQNIIEDWSLKFWKNVILSGKILYLSSNCKFLGHIQRGHMSTICSQTKMQVVWTEVVNHEIRNAEKRWRCLYMNQQGISQKQIADTSGRSRCAVQGLLGHHRDNGDVSYIPSFCWPRCTTVTGRHVWQLVRRCLEHMTCFFFTSWRFVYFMTNFCVFDLWYTFWRHDEFLWCHDALFDFVMNFLMSWRTIWRHDVFWRHDKLVWHHVVTGAQIR